MVRRVWYAVEWPRELKMLSKALAHRALAPPQL